MRSERGWIRLFASEHIPGHYRIQCPRCQGGRSGEHSLSVTLDPSGAAKWLCHRASCSNRGSTLKAPVRLHEMEWTHHRKSAVKPYHGEKHLPSLTDCVYFSTRFGIDHPVTQRCVRRTVPDGEKYGAYVFPIFDLWGRVRGDVVRQPVWKGEPQAPLQAVPDQPKAKTWPASESPTQSWYRPIDPAIDTVIIVEDQVSAMAAASAGYTGLALLGTHMNLDRVREIQRNGAERNILALDADAEGQALRLAQKWGMVIPGFRVHLLHEDLKDVPDVHEEIDG